MGFHEEVCLKERPRLAVWFAVVFGAFGLVGVATLHHKIDSGAVARVGYLVLAIGFFSFFTSMKCFVERALCALLLAVYAIDLFVALLGSKSPREFLVARVATTSLWFVMALICIAWAMRRKA